jgi:naphthoate synthase
LTEWQPWGTYQDILVDRSAEGIARVAINRPAKRNAFRPQTVNELCDAFTRIRDDRAIGVVLFTGVGPAEDGAYAFALAVTRACVAMVVMSVTMAFQG